MTAYAFDVARKVVFRLGSEDISAIRFGISPGHEVCHAVRSVLDPGAHPLQWGWLKEVRTSLPREELGLLALVIGTDGYFPDFLTCSPSWEMSPEEEIERLRGVGLAQVRLDLGKVLVRSSGRRRQRVQELLDHPLRSRARLAEAWAVFFEVAVAPYWEQLRRLMSADISTRVQQVAAAGVAAMVDGLHDTVHWRHDAIEVELRLHEEVLDCAGSGVVLAPSVMGRRCAVLTERPVQPTLFYPVAGVAETWPQGRTSADAALSGVLGTGRARVLLCLDTPASTTEVATRCGLVVSTASHHLAALRAARLVDARRDGPRVLHSRTALGEALTGTG